MTANPVEALFDEDYLYFYELDLTPEHNFGEVDSIWCLLNLSVGMTVLDLACGHGRIANQLAARGCNVIGLDASAFFLDKASHDAAELGVEVEYIQGDMRSLRWNDRFECIVNWFTAFGYFDDDENRLVLREAHRTLKMGGKLLIEVVNRDRILREFRPVAVVERDGNYMIDQRRYDVLTGRIYTEQVVIREGQTRRMNFFVRLFTYPELRDWLLQAGFSKVQGYGEDGEPFGLNSRRMILVATK